MTKTQLLSNKRYKVHVKKGDTVQIISGTDKKKIGIITKVIYRKKQVIVQNINLKIKHNRPKREGELGTITKIEKPIDSSNVMLYDRDRKIASKYKIVIDPQGLKTRILKKLEINLKNNTK
jgi:large subunit ribosomal protein L24